MKNTIGGPVASDTQITNSFYAGVFFSQILFQLFVVAPFFVEEL
jgi:hypothetical protein